MRYFWNGDERTGECALHILRTMATGAGMDAEEIAGIWNRRHEEDAREMIGDLTNQEIEIVA